MQEFIPQLSGCCFLELFCDCASQTYFFFALTSSNMFPAKLYLAVEDTVRLSRRKIISVFRLREACVMRQRNGDLMNPLQ